MIPIPEELLEQVERGNVLLFVGERIVRDAQGQVVLDQLTAELLARCGIDGAYTFPEAAQAYEDSKGRQALVQFLRDQLEALGDAPQKSHRLIAALTDCQVLATTCLDRRLERAFAEADRPLDLIIGNLDVAFEEERKAQLYKLRGSLERPTSLVLTEDDYEVFFEDRSSISIVLQGYLARKTILFVGYDLSDTHFKRLYRKVTAPLDDYARRAYAFGEIPPPKVCRWCRRHGIEVVEVDATAFLESLVSQVQARRAARVQPTPTAPTPPTTPVPEPLPERPYKLLDYYEAKDTAIFFGRRQETRKLTSLIHAHRLVLLYGASGVGKTSLLLAGAVPRLEQADPPYETVYIRALEDPAGVIRRAVRRKLPEADLPQDGELLDFLHAATRALDGPLVILLDQFEEFFIRLSPEYRAAFVAQLGTLYDARDVPVKVVLSLREDWLASVGEIEARIPEVFRTRMRLLPLTRAQAQQAITAPVERLGASYEPALVERLLNDLAGGDGSEVATGVHPSHPDSSRTAIMPPQLQLVCNALYESLKPGEHTITLATYEHLGGARGVLQQYLEEELARLGKEEQALARDLLAELVTSQRTKAVKDGAELALSLGVEKAELEPVLEKLVRARLLRPLERAEEAGRSYELAHEYLIAEIALGPEAVARKEAEELLRQGLDNWERFEALLSIETFTLIEAQRDRLRLSPEAQALMLRSALRHGRSVGYWLARLEDEALALDLTAEALLAPAGETARRSLSPLPSDAEPGRFRALATRLEAVWRGSRGTERARASEALWSLRRFLPGGQRLRLAVGRSPRLLRRVALPLAAALVVALAFAAILWGPRFWTRKPDLTWIDIPAGQFLMGSDPTMDPNAAGDEMPQHPVTLDAYQIGKHEITNAAYARCVRATICSTPGNRAYYDDPAYAQHPVLYVSWDQARIFCQWVGGRLPTEAEWEKAASWDEAKQVKSIYPWGNEAPTCELANYGGCVGSTTEVGSYPDGDSPAGASDMAGNVWEWVYDWYDSDYYSQLAYNPNQAWNPRGPSSGTYKVVRGGSFYGDWDVVRAAYRYGRDPGAQFNYVGFRCVRPPGK